MADYDASAWWLFKPLQNDEVNNPGTLLTLSDGSISRTNVDRSSLTRTAGSLGKVTAADVAECVRKDQTAERMLPDFVLGEYILFILAAAAAAAFHSSKECTGPADSLPNTSYGVDITSQQ
jgi:hypothetical protein